MKFTRNITTFFALLAMLMAGEVMVAGKAPRSRLAAKAGQPYVRPTKKDFSAFVKASQARRKASELVDKAAQNYGYMPGNEVKELVNHLQSMAMITPQGLVNELDGFIETIETLNRQHYSRTGATNLRKATDAIRAFRDTIQRDADESSSQGMSSDDESAGSESSSEDENAKGRLVLVTDESLAQKLTRTVGALAQGVKSLGSKTYNIGIKVSAFVIKPAMIGYATQLLINQSGGDAALTFLTTLGVPGAAVAAPYVGMAAGHLFGAVAREALQAKELYQAYKNGQLTPAQLTARATRVIKNTAVSMAFTAAVGYVVTAVTPYLAPHLDPLYQTAKAYVQSTILTPIEQLLARNQDYFAQQKAEVMARLGAWLGTVTPEQLASGVLPELPAEVVQPINATFAEVCPVIQEKFSQAVTLYDPNLYAPKRLFGLLPAANTTSITDAAAVAEVVAVEIAPHAAQANETMVRALVPSGTELRHVVEEFGVPVSSSDDVVKKIAEMIFNVGEYVGEGVWRQSYSEVQAAMVAMRYDFYTMMGW